MTARRSRPGPAALRAQVAVRAHTTRAKPSHTRPKIGQPELYLILDTETRTDAAQPLLFGAYQVRDAKGRLQQEGLVHGKLTPDEAAVLERYVDEHPAANGGHLRLWDREAFIRRVFLPLAAEVSARVVGFNLPFDLSRLACGWNAAQNGGFTLWLLDAVSRSGRRIPDRYKPLLRIKALDSRRNFITFASSSKLDQRYRAGKRVRPGRFLDLRMFSYALTDRNHSLDSAAAAFGVAIRKHHTEEHGRLTAEYVDYNRHDVEVTWQLHQALMEEWFRHPIELAPEQAYSPAAVSKAYLEAMGVTPPAERSSVLVERLGHAMTAYFGGRTECRIRGVPLPVRYVDFASMYPTVFSLLGLWDWVAAADLRSEDATADARRLVATLDRGALHDPAVWRQLAGVFCRVPPAGELLPARARYGADQGDDDHGSSSVAWTIGLNHVHADVDLWYTLADVLAAKLLGGRAPEILEAFRVYPVGRLDSLRSVSLRGGTPADPATTDVFRLATEERARVRADRRLSAEEAKRRAQFLKTLANGGAYGIFAEVRQRDPVAGGTTVTAFGLDPLSVRVTTPEEPGAFSFPPLAASVTGAARLLLALAQADLEALGGGYVACDTDSLLIVASEQQQLVACPNGPERLPDGTPAVRAITWRAVDELLAGLDPLNPYAPGTVPHLVKLEAENTGPDGRPQELWALAGSSKRYALYDHAAEGIVIRKPSEHGLGLYRSPLEPSPDWREGWREWIDVVWRRSIALADGADPGPEPAWFALPAVSQCPITSAAVLAPFRTVNEGLAYDAQIKPFGFLLLGHVDRLSAPPADIALPVTPMAPFTSRPDELLELPWHNRRDGKALRVTARRRPRPAEVRLQTIGDVVAAYRLHPEHKSGDPRGGLGRRGSVGLLPRLEMHAVGYPLHLGKESNRLDEVEDGLVQDADEVYVEYRDERREWEAALPALQRLRDERGWRYLAERSGLSERAVRYALNGGKLPRRAAREQLTRLASEDVGPLA